MSFWKVSLYNPREDHEMKMYFKTEEDVDVFIDFIREIHVNYCECNSPGYCLCESRNDKHGHKESRIQKEVFLVLQKLYGDLANYKVVSTKEYSFENFRVKNIF